MDITSFIGMAEGWVVIIAAILYAAAILYSKRAKHVKELEAEADKVQERLVGLFKDRDAIQAKEMTEMRTEIQTLSSRVARLIEFVIDHTCTATTPCDQRGKPQMGLIDSILKG